MKMRSTCLAGVISLAPVLWIAAFISEGKAGAVIGDQSGNQPGQHVVWDFDHMPTGRLPQGWKAAETNGKGRPGKWEVKRGYNPPSTPNALALIRTANVGETYNLVLAGSARYQDLDLEVKVRALSGGEDRGGGLIWRVSDSGNYYLACWDPLKDKLCLYSVKAARRTQIASVNVTADSRTWHTIKVTHLGNKIGIAFDGKALLSQEDTTFPSPGMIGLWTKADACTAFDDFKVQPKATGN